MPADQEVTHGELLLQLGELKGEVAAVKQDIGRVKDVQGKIFDKIEASNIILAKVEANTENSRRDSARACDLAEDIMTKPHHAPPPIALEKTKPWEKPMGDLMGEIVIGALKLVGIGIVVWLIIHGVGSGDI